MYYFAYGSNMNPERMRERGVNFSERKRAVLRGWKLLFNKVASRKVGVGYANIVRDNNGVVEGILYEINPEDIRKLDRYEGYPEHYYRDEVEVELDNGEKVKAVVYIARPDKTAEGLKPTKEYLEHLLKGCDLLSEEYCEMLRSVETV